MNKFPTIFWISHFIPQIKLPKLGCLKFSDLEIWRREESENFSLSELNSFSVLVRKQARARHVCYDDLMINRSLWILVSLNVFPLQRPELLSWMCSILVVTITVRATSIPYDFLNFIFHSPDKASLVRIPKIFGFRNMTQRGIWKLLTFVIR